VTHLLDLYIKLLTDKCLWCVRIVPNLADMSATADQRSKSLPSRSL
jgi:hypothetical protein